MTTWFVNGAGNRISASRIHGLLDTGELVRAEAGILRAAGWDGGDE